MSAKVKFRELSAIVSRRITGEFGFKRVKPRLLSRTDTLRRAVAFDSPWWSGEDCYAFGLTFAVGLPGLAPGPPPTMQWGVWLSAGSTMAARPKVLEVYSSSDVEEIVERDVWPLVTEAMSQFLLRYEHPHDLYELVAYNWAELDRLGAPPYPFLVMPGVPLKRLELAAVYAVSLGLADELPKLLARMPVEAHKAGVDSLLPEVYANIELAKRGDFVASVSG